MARALSLFFAILSYAIFFATFLYLIVFVGDLAMGGLHPRTVDSPASSLTMGAALLIDAGLIALFGLQHSVMARQGFKKAWLRFVPKHAERSMYVLLASLMLIIMYAFWQAIPATVWDIRTPIVRDLLGLLFWAGWGTVLLSTFLINHFELFGLQQAWTNMSGREVPAPAFRTPFLYRFVRHPLYLGFFIAFWSTATMTIGHLLLAAGLSVYMLIAIRYEERDLVAFHGRDYEDYRGRVGMLLPRFRSRA